MSKKTIKAKVTFAADGPMQLSEDIEQDIVEPTDEQKAIIDQVGTVVKAYLTAAGELLNGKYAHLKDWAPAHLADRGNVLVGCCPDGVVIRYERKADTKRLITSWFSEELPDVVALLSQLFVHCYKDRNYTSTIPTTGIELKLFTQNPITGVEQDLVSARIGVDAVLERPAHLPQPPQKPFCLLSIRNEFAFHLLGELLPDDAPAQEGQRFLARSLLRLGVGWECIEVYPFFTLDYWKEEYAPVWAENDLLAAVVARQFQEGQFQSLDPNAAARRQFGELLKKYKELLDSNPEREEILQRFLCDNPALLCPTHTKFWPKLALGARATDFVFRDALGDYLLVELERSTHSLFLTDGHPTRELNHARGQIVDWKRYLEDNLSTVQREVGLTGISTNPKSLIVIGRSQSLTPENRRKLVTLENESPKLKIMTYDDVLENAKAVVENLLGTLWETTGNAQIYYLQDT